MEKSFVDFERQAEIGLITLNNPQKRNVLSRATLAQLTGRLVAAEADADVRCVILRAQGPVFSAGHDLAEIIAASDIERESLFALCSQTMQTIRGLSLPVIAQVQGLATAAGCQLAATCDLVVAAEEASFATPGIKIGLFCSTPAVALSRAIGSKKAMEMLLTAQPVNAREAERIGLVNRVVAREQLDQVTLALARQIAAASPLTLGLGKRAFYEQLELAEPLAYQVTERVMVENARAPDAIEGMQAFLERRPPRWGGS
ncbi:MAG TPA: enoyl-CoA hydratase [Pirellulales bacterium]|jgi:enoyl-CoA hydratase/carnithine racemase|nr:enoyl-CoA hydratase [Pirellulales bacterium]